MARDYYEILGVPKDASAHQIMEASVSYTHLTQPTTYHV